MMDYTEIKELDELLNQAENILADIVGRYQAQRMIYVFTQLMNDASQKPRNLWKEIYELGRKSK